MTQKAKQIIIAIIVIIVAFIGFKMFFVSDVPSDTALVAEQTSNAEFIDGQVILALLEKLDQVTLDESIFSNKVFTSLISFERPLENQITGRANPFLPIGIDSSTLPQGTFTPGTI